MQVYLMKRGDVDGWFREAAFTTRHKAWKAARAIIKQETFERSNGSWFWAQEKRDHWHCWMKHEAESEWQRSCGMEICVEVMEVS